MLRVGIFLLAVAAALAGAAAADMPTLQGHVGPAFSITLKDGTGAAVAHLAPGSYGLHVVDEADEHDFHLKGPGVDRMLGQEGQGTFDETVTLALGTYTFFCDFHPTSMKGSFTVGTPTTAKKPPAKKPKPKPKKKKKKR